MGAMVFFLLRFVWQTVGDQQGNSFVGQWASWAHSFVSIGILGVDTTMFIQIGLTCVVYYAVQDFVRKGLKCLFRGSRALHVMPAQEVRGIACDVAAKAYACEKALKSHLDRYRQQPSLRDVWKRSDDKEKQFALDVIQMTHSTDIREVRNLFCTDERYKVVLDKRVENAKLDIEEQLRECDRDSAMVDQAFEDLDHRANQIAAGVRRGVDAALRVQAAVATGWTTLMVGTNAKR